MYNVFIISKMDFSILLLVILFLKGCVAEQFLNSVYSEVTRGNYTYYSLTYEGPITLYLHSKVGDADLYVSQTSKKPTFEPDTYCLQSSTCGLDVIEIPKNFLRPIRIGVYGHPSHEVSVYVLEVYYREEEEELSDFFSETQFQEEDEEKDTSEEVKLDAPFWKIQKKIRQQVSNDNKGESYERKGRRENDESFIWTLILSFVDLLLEILFL